MTNINCSENCIYQKDGKCYLENIENQKINTHHSCAYFIKTNQPQNFSTNQEYSSPN